MTIFIAGKQHKKVVMSLKFIETSISDLFIVVPHVYRDDRGFYVKYFDKASFASNNLPVDFSESSYISTYRGVLRGLHYQVNPAQGKLVHVVQGSVFDVAVDLKKDSDTFGKYISFYLSGDEYKAIYIPGGFAHGFLCLEDRTIFSYQSTGEYVPENSSGIIWNDEELNIEWPVGNIPLVVSEKDNGLHSFDQYKNGLNIR
jgi:dTDP-4-dehydrorhamnose 3,5-epimerase